MSILSNVAVDGNSPASEAKNKAIEDVNAGISEISSKPTETQAEAFKEFMLQHRPK